MDGGLCWDPVPPTQSQGWGQRGLLGLLGVGGSAPRVQHGKTWVERAALGWGGVNLGRGLSFLGGAGWFCGSSP